MTEFLFSCSRCTSGQLVSYILAFWVPYYPCSLLDSRLGYNYGQINDTSWRVYPWKYTKCSCVLFSCCYINQHSNSYNSFIDILEGYVTSTHARNSDVSDALHGVIHEQWIVNCHLYPSHLGTQMHFIHNTARDFLQPFCLLMNTTSG